MRAICPNNSDHKLFVTTAHEVHDWEVDENGNFVEDLGCVDISHRPEPGNIWTCKICNTEAKVEW